MFWPYYIYADIVQTQKQTKKKNPAKFPHVPFSVNNSDFDINRYRHMQLFFPRNYFEVTKSWNQHMTYFYCEAPLEAYTLTFSVQNKFLK